MTKEDYKSLWETEILDLDKLGLVFKSNRNKDLDFWVISDEFGQGNIIVLELKYKMSIFIRVDITHRIPKSVWYCKYREKSSKGKLLKPEDKSSWQYFQSIQNVAIGVINTYVSVHSLPIVYFLEWWRNYTYFYKARWSATKNWLYFNEKYGMLPADYSVTSLPEEKQENKIIHKTRKIFQ
jgi:hypothetical protein